VELWNDRYVKMYKLAPDRLRVGCTLDEMLDARKAAGTAYRDLGQYGSKLRMAMTTRSPDNLVAQLDDGRIVNVSYRPTQNGCWVSTHEDITERAQNEARIAHLARGAIGLSASPLRPLTRRPAASWRACLSGSECPFPCR
jgi:diguanylate cyclase